MTRTLAKRRTEKSDRIRMGRTVRFRFGIRRIEGVVVEDRGPLGIGGRRLYRVEFLVEPCADSPSYIELPAEDLELVEGSPATSKVVVAP